jgi:hypothetical protein
VPKAQPALVLASVDVCQHVPEGPATVDAASVGQVGGKATLEGGGHGTACWRRVSRCGFKAKLASQWL